MDTDNMSVLTPFHIISIPLVLFLYHALAEILQKSSG
jgi:hypothetical protein